MGSSRASLETNATDVLGATAAMMEIAKIFGNLKKNKSKIYWNMIFLRYYSELQVLGSDSLTE
jgi:hypothetical protein